MEEDENAAPPEAGLDMPTPSSDARTKVRAILASFHGKTTTITNAGRDNMRTVNRLGRVVALRHVATDKTFRHNITRYHTDALEEDILIGARREGSGVWSLVAELAPREASR
jgi:hypothetical protein